ncbi:MAG: hypothetical protein JJ855_15145 [Rhodospirillales bacterium]|nr:hypothetical protein [Rhodospirillales bacterium]
MLHCNIKLSFCGFGDSAALVRGEGSFGHYEPTPAPAHDFGETTVAFREVHRHGA